MAQFKISLAVFALISNAEASVIQGIVRPLQFHWNEDPNSVPDPLSGQMRLTSTQVKYLRNKQTDLARERFVRPYDAWNGYAKEPLGHESGNIYA